MSFGVAEGSSKVTRNVPIGGADLDGIATRGCCAGCDAPAAVIGLNSTPPITASTPMTLVDPVDLIDAPSTNAAFSWL